MRMQEIQTFRQGDSILHLSSEFADLFQAGGLAAPDTFLSCGDVVRRKGNKENVRLTLGEGEKRKLFFLKRHTGDPGNPGLVEWENTRRAASLGIPTARPAAAGASKEGSFFCSEELRGAEPLDDYLSRGSLAPSRLREIARTAARLAARLHDENLFHRDLYLCHFFILDQGPGATDPGFRLFLIDLQRVFRPRILARRWMVKDLAQANHSAREGFTRRSDRLRFLRAYLEARGLDPGPGPLRRLVRSILRKTRRMEQRSVLRDG
jgi:heptose I phosphotransferase